MRMVERDPLSVVGRNREGNTLNLVSEDNHNQCQDSRGCLLSEPG